MNLFFVIIFILLSYSASCQITYYDKQKPHKDSVVLQQTSILNSILHFDSLQYSRVFNMVTEIMKNRDSLFNTNSKLSADEMWKLNMQFDEKLKEIITDEQYRKYLHYQPNIFIY